jgi:hypothetical protein
MNSRPLYENLDTSFVNLSALVRYLRLREFVGRIKIELNNYQAEIVLLEANRLSVRENDKISGRIAEGEEAFQSILIRARETGGTIHVYQTIKTEVKTPAPVPVPTKVSNGNSAPAAKPVEVVKTAAATAQNGKTAQPLESPKKIEPIAIHPKFPFDLHNKVEAKARQNQLSESDWHNLLRLTGELLGTIDQTLATANLDFKLAFSKARSEISADYPFLHPSRKLFEYQTGKVVMSEQVSAKLFVASIIEVLRRILEKLGSNPKFAEVYRTTTQKVLALINLRQSFYDKFSVTTPLKKVLGIQGS